MKNYQRTGFLLFTTAFWLLLAAGCGSSENVADVTGTVTLAGQPLSNATVTFIARESRNVARARTDANGRYRLRCSPAVPIAEVARVSITTYSSGNPDGDPPLPRIPEEVPAKYNVQTELTATVTPGENVLDFALLAEGPVIQPDAQKVLR